MSTEIVMPRLSDTMDRGTVAKWNKQSGDRVKRGEVLLEIETDKANMELESYADGILANIMVHEGETAEVGAPIGVVVKDEAELKSMGSDSGADRSSTETRTQPSQSDQSSETTMRPEPSRSQPSRRQDAETDGHQDSANGRIKASPLAKRLARERGIDLAKIHGTGPGGRIVRDDVETFSSRTSEPQIEEEFAPAGVDEERQLSRMELTVGRRLSESKFSAPHFYVTAEIDMTHAVRMRTQINDAEPDLRVSFNDLIVKAAGVALEQSPRVNVSYRDGHVIQRGSINVGIAVDLPDGLIVPVIKDVSKKGLRQISQENKRIIAAARDGRLKPDSFQGGTFTVSNLGMFGVDQFTAIINPPESAILAVGAIMEKPVVVDGEIVIRSRMRVTLSSDHRVVYGADAASFLAKLRHVLEHPVLAIL